MRDQWGWIQHPGKQRLSGQGPACRRQPGEADGLIGEDAAQRRNLDLIGLARESEEDDR